MFTVITDQHSAAISVQAVDDAGYSLGGINPNGFRPGAQNRTAKG